MGFYLMCVFVCVSVEGRRQSDHLGLPPRLTHVFFLPPPNIDNLQRHSSHDLRNPLQ